MTEPITRDMTPEDVALLRAQAPRRAISGRVIEFVLEVLSTLLTIIAPILFLIALGAVWLSRLLVGWEGPLLPPALVLTVAAVLAFHLHETLHAARADSEEAAAIEADLRAGRVEETRLRVCEVKRVSAPGYPDVIAFLRLADGRIAVRYAPDATETTLGRDLRHLRFPASGTAVDIHSGPAVPLPPPSPLLAEVSTWPEDGDWWGGPWDGIEAWAAG